MLEVELTPRVSSALSSTSLVPAPISTQNIDGLVSGSAPRQKRVEVGTSLST